MTDLPPGPLDLSRLDPTELLELEALIDEQERRRLADRLGAVRLTPRQVDVLNSTSHYQQVALFAGNQQGKSLVLNWYAAHTLQGTLPDEVPVILGTWDEGEVPEAVRRAAGGRQQWLECSTVQGAPVEHLVAVRPLEARRWPGPVTMWCSSFSGEKVRETFQDYLLGPVPVESTLGSGFLLRNRIGEHARAVGSVTQLLDYVKVRWGYVEELHVRIGNTGPKWSHLGFKAGKRGVDAYTGVKVDAVLMDEIHPYEVYVECLARLTQTAGLLMLVYTPADGMTELAKAFFPLGLEAPIDEPGNKKAWVMNAGHVTFMTEGQREELGSKYPPHERMARVDGLPAMGRGLVLPYTREQIVWQGGATVPSDWEFGIGMDLGLGGATGHPTAFAILASDPGNTTVRVLGALKPKGPDGEWLRPRDQLVAALRGWWAESPYGAYELPTVFWPHDGEQVDAKSGLSVAEDYEALGLPMWETSACYVDDKLGPQGDGSYVQKVCEMIENGTFAVQAGATEWFAEQRMWHYVDGKPLAIDDDLMKATKYAFIMRRHWSQLAYGAQAGFVVVSTL